MKTPILSVHLELGNDYYDSEFLELPLDKEKKKELNKIIKKYQEKKRC